MPAPSPGLHSITLTQAYPAMGEGFLVDRQGRLLARGMMSAHG